MYSRVATRLDSALHWHWESRVIATLDVLLRVLRLYRTMPCDHICVFFSSSVEGLDLMLDRANEGLASDAHCLTKSLPLSSLPNHHHSQKLLTLHQDHLFASVPLHKGTEVAMIRSLNQIFHEARKGVAVVVAERFRIGSFPGGQTWERK